MPAGNGSAGLPNGVLGMREMQQIQPQHYSQNVAQKQPIASTSASPTRPSNTKIRKRQKVEYDPVKRFYNDHPGTWDIVQVEDVVSHAMSKRQKRTARDLGFCDIHTVKMSLRSRLGPEVAYALNTLGLLSATSDQQPAFAIGRHPELLEDILDLFEEAVKGEEDDSEDDSAAEPAASSSSSRHIASGSSTSPAKAGPSKPGAIPKQEPREAYSDTLRDAYNDEFKLRPASASSARESFAGLDRAQVVLACLALFRNLSLSEHPSKPTLTDPRLVTTVLLTTKTPRQTKDLPEPPTRPLRLSQTQLLQARKEALQIVGNLGHHIPLEQHPSWVGHAIVGLLDYFLDLGEAPDIPGFPGMGLMNSFSPSIDASLYALARVMLSDANRDSITKLPQSNTTLRPFILSKVPTLLQLLPLTDLDFSMINSEPALVRIELVAMCLFNLVYVASPDVRKKLRESPGTIKSLVRVVKKLYGIHLATASQEQQAPNSLYLVLCRRCLEVLRILSEDEAAGAGQHTTGSQEGVAWFGSYFEGRDAGEGTSGGSRTRPSLLFAKQDFVELLSLPVSDRSIFSALADCT